jgi:hypothetical protein
VFTNLDSVSALSTFVYAAQLTMTVGFMLFKKEFIVSSLNKSKVLIVEKIQDKEPKLLEIF